MWSGCWGASIEKTEDDALALGYIEADCRGISMPEWSLKLLPSTETELPRVLFRQRLERRYIGWDDELDRRFDQHSVSMLLYADGDDTPSAVCRLIMRQWAGRVYALPMEMGDLASFQVPSSYPAVCEASGLVFTSAAAAEELARSIARWTSAQAIQRVYAIFDPAQTALRTYYLEGACMHLVAGAQVAYSSFLHRASRQPVWWNIVAGDPSVDGERLLSRRDPAGPISSLRRPEEEPQSSSSSEAMDAAPCITTTS